MRSRPCPPPCPPARPSRVKLRAARPDQAAGLLPRSITSSLPTTASSVTCAPLRTSRCTTSCAAQQMRGAQPTLTVGERPRQQVVTHQTATSCKVTDGTTVLYLVEVASVQLLFDLNINRTRYAYGLWLEKK